MTKKEQVNYNIGLAFDFARYLVRNPRMLKHIPDGAEIEFVDKDMAIRDGQNGKAGKRKKKYVRVKREFELI